MRTRILIGIMGVAFIGAAAPALAQYYPPNRGGVVGAIINSYRYG